MIRLIAFALVLFSTVSFADVDSKKIKSVTKALSEILIDSGSYKLKPASPLEMMKQLAFGPLQMDDFQYDVSSAREVDGSSWGIIKMAEAISWVANADALILDEEGNEVRNSPKAKKAAELMKSLYGTGAIFGVGPFGAVQCGVTFPALLIIDTKAGVIYTFNTEGSGC